jgi:hypothetical protein
VPLNLINPVALTETANRAVFLRNDLLCMEQNFLEFDELAGWIKRILQDWIS